MFAAVAGLAQGQQQQSSCYPADFPRDIQQPYVIFKVEPKYTGEARRARIEGALVLCGPGGTRTMFAESSLVWLLSG